MNDVENKRVEKLREVVGENIKNMAILENMETEEYMYIDKYLVKVLNFKSRKIVNSVDKITSNKIQK